MRGERIQYHLKWRSTVGPMMDNIECFVIFQGFQTSIGNDSYSQEAGSGPPAPSLDLSVSSM